MTDMKTATSLALVAIGAIFAFAITRSPAFLNFQVVGWVLMLTGGAGALIPRRGNGWLRRSLVVKNDEAEKGPDKPERQRVSRMLVPAGLLSSRHRGLQATGQVERETIEEYIEE
jgi:hypothetical protein